MQAKARSCACKHALPGSGMRFAFIEVWKEFWPVEFLCRVMRVTSRGFCAWRVRPMSQRQRDDMVILAHLREQHRLSLQCYGRPRMTEELQKLRVNVGHRREGRLMRDNGIKIISTQKYKPLRIAIMRSTLQPIYSIRIFLLPGQSRNGQVTSFASGAARAGCIKQ